MPHFFRKNALAIYFLTQCNNSWFTIFFIATENHPLKRNMLQT